MASPVDTSVKFFTDDMVGASMLNGTAGSYITVLDATLVTGFSVRSATSLVVSGGTTTLTFSGGAHAAQPQSVIQVSGVTDLTDLNGEQKVLTVSSSTVTFATSLPDGTASGTITFKMAPLGWTKVYSGTNVAVYKAAAPEATGFCLRVDDTGTTTARVMGYETMVDVNTGSGRFPTEAQFAGGMHWPKSNSANTTPRRWALFGDHASFAMHVLPNTAVSAAGAMFGFGDFVPNRSGDAYACAIFGADSSIAASSNPSPGDLGSAVAVGNTASHGYVARAVSSLGGSQIIGKMSAYLSGQSGNANSGQFAFPDPSNNGLIVSPVDLRSGTSLRGRLAGIYHSPQPILDAYPHASRIDGTGAFAGKQFVAVYSGATNGSTSAAGPTFVDVTGPWR